MVVTRHTVVPLAGTWIEIRVGITVVLLVGVVPLAGTWIEIDCIDKVKSYGIVVPLAGTWIEISVKTPAVR